MEDPERTVEAEVRERILAILRDWVDPSPASTERFLSAVADDFTGHGTGPGDYYADRDDLRAMVEREHAEMTLPFTLDVPRLNVRLPHPTVALAEGQIQVNIEADGETLVEAPRFTFGLERRDGRWLLVHFHFSVPDAMQSEGDTMADVLWSRNQELERLVTDRTAELEAAHRDAQVEAALERVRSRSMAMHHSDELSDIAVVLFQELDGLGIAPRRCGFAIKQPDEHTWQFWHTTNAGQAIARAGVLSEQHVPFFQGVFAAWRDREVASFTSTFSGDDLDRVIHLLIEQTDVDLPDAEAEVQQGLYPEQVCFNFFFFTHGGLLAHTLTPLQEEARAVLERFARVFDLAYRRFLDLQATETRARETQRQASLDRIRAEIASMRTADDLQHITPLVWRELTALGVPFFRCGVFLMDRAREKTRVFLTTPEGGALAQLTLGFDDLGLVSSVAAHWRRREVYTEQWDADRIRSWTSFLEQHDLATLMPTAPGTDDPAERLVLHFVPFEQGMLYVGSKEPLDAEALGTVQSLADALAVAYARYEDFQRLEAKNRELETAMSELRVTQEQLIQSEKMASLGALTAGIAHEIKNPLNFVNNFAALSRELVDEIHAERDEGERQALLNDLKANAAKIEAHGKRADAIVRAMMDHARSGGGERRAVRLNALVEEYADLAWHGLRARRPEARVTVERDLAEDLGDVEAVPQEIGRVLINLLDNAFDAALERAEMSTEPYVPTVTVSTRQRGGRAEVCIADNGTGMSDAVRRRVFEPFFTTKPTGQGTGLGLSLSHDIVVQGHSGTLTVESAEGDGTTFTVSLPTA